jgi:hypothetical protein
MLLEVQFIGNLNLFSTNEAAAIRDQSVGAALEAGLPDFFGTNYQNIPNDHRTYQIAIKWRED